MEFRVFNGFIEMDGQPVAKLLDKVNEWEVKDELKNYDGSNEPGCDCDLEATYNDGYENGEKDKEKEIKRELFGILCRMDADGKISPEQANMILREIRSSDRLDLGGDRDRNRVEGFDAVYWHAAHALLATNVKNTKEKISMALDGFK